MQYPVDRPVIVFVNGRQYQVLNAEEAVRSGEDIVAVQLMDDQGRIIERTLEVTW